MPVPVVRVEGVVLESTRDFNYEYLNAAGETVAAPTDTGTYTLKVTGTGNYSDSLESTFLIDSASLADATMQDIPDHIYDGNAYTPVPVIELNGKTLQANTDFVYGYRDAAGNLIAEPKDRGVYTVVIEAAGNYSGMLETTFNIVDDTAPTPDSGDPNNGQSNSADSSKTLPSTGDITAPIASMLVCSALASVAFLRRAHKRS